MSDSLNTSEIILHSILDDFDSISSDLQEIRTDNNDSNIINNIQTLIDDLGDLIVENIRHYGEENNETSEINGLFDSILTEINKLSGNFDAELKSDLKQKIKTCKTNFSRIYDTNLSAPVSLPSSLNESEDNLMDGLTPGPAPAAGGRNNKSKKSKKTMKTRKSRKTMKTRKSRKTMKTRKSKKSGRKK
jgi:hypothetical protein